MSATVEITNDIALIRMDDGKANAINFDMVAALNAALDTAARKAVARLPRTAGAAAAHAGRPAEDLAGLADGAGRGLDR